jgi:DNA polymerase (family 10)/putative hydrolase
MLKKYNQYLFTGEWHIHTSYTDGENTVLEYAEKAVELSIPLLAFTEHVRLNIEYNYDELLNDILIVKKKFPKLIILSGVEAKVLPDGQLDCPIEILEKVDYKLFAFHSFPENLDKYIFSIKNILNNYTVNAWAHPGLFFKKYNNLKLPNKEINKIFKLMNKKNVLLEVNFKYNLPKIDWISKYIRNSENNTIVFGADIHSVEDLFQSWKIKHEFQNRRQKMLADNIDVTTFMVWFVENYPESVKIMKENPDEIEKRFHGVNPSETQKQFL